MEKERFKKPTKEQLIQASIDVLSVCPHNDRREIMACLITICEIITDRLHATGDILIMSSDEFEIKNEN